MPGIEPRADGWEAQTLPLCYAVPKLTITDQQVTIYTLFIIVGILGNALILWAVLGRESMRTARNVFIGTLATSDLFLCLFTMPSTLWEVIRSLYDCSMSLWF